MLLELLRAGNVDSSGSNGVGRGEGKWMFVRSGREPPVLCVAGISVVVFSWSADGKMLNKGERKRKEVSDYKSAWTNLVQSVLKKEGAIYKLYTALFVVLSIVMHSQRFMIQGVTHRGSGLPCVYCT